MARFPVVLEWLVRSGIDLKQLKETDLIFKSKKDPREGHRWNEPLTVKKTVSGSMLHNLQI